MKTFTREKLLLEPPPLGCVLYLPGLPGGASKIYDRSPYGNIGTITGATWVKLPSGLWPLSFDGIDDKVNCGNSTSLNTEVITVAAWVYLTAFNPTNGIVISKGYYSLVTGWTLYIHANGSARFVINAYGGKEAVSPILSLNRWYYIAGTYDRNKIRLFVNGVEGTPYTLTEAMTTNTESVHLGTRSAGSGYYHSGKIALVKIFNRCLTALEVLNIYNEEKRFF